MDSKDLYANFYRKTDDKFTYNLSANLKRYLKDL